MWEKFQKKIFCVCLTYFMNNSWKMQRFITLQLTQMFIRKNCALSNYCFSLCLNGNDIVVDNRSDRRPNYFNCIYCSTIYSQNQQILNETSFPSRLLSRYKIGIGVGSVWVFLHTFLLHLPNDSTHLSIKLYPNSYSSENNSFWFVRCQLEIRAEKNGSTQPIHRHYGVVYTFFLMYNLTDWVEHSSH